MWLSDILKGVMAICICLMQYSSAQTFHQDSDLYNFQQLYVQNKCGVRSESRGTSHIMNGDDAYLGQYPWIVNIFFSQEAMEHNYPMCGGTIISDRYVLTAGHCCIDKNNSPLVDSVRIGELYLKDHHFKKNIKVDRIIVHGNFYHTYLLNDICLLHLAERVVFDDLVQPICLPFHETFQQMNMDGMSMEIAGWGRSEFSSNVTPWLQTVSAPIVPTGVCQQFYPTLDTRNSICVGGKIDGVFKRGCKGDSGGPLMKPFLTNETKTYYLFGINSYSGKSEDPRHLCDSEFPSVFTKVTQYTKWILYSMI